MGVKNQRFQVLHRLATGLYWLFILCGVNDKADSRVNYCVEGGQDLIDMRYLR